MAARMRSLSVKSPTAMSTPRFRKSGRRLTVCAEISSHALDHREQLVIVRLGGIYTGGLHDQLVAEHPARHDRIGTRRSHDVLVALLAGAHLHAILAHDEAGRLDVESAVGVNTPSITSTWACTCRLAAEPKRCTNVIAPV
jgi:hypothetical protein